MSNNCINPPNEKFSFQILYRGIDAEGSRLEVGKEPDFPIELEISLNSIGVPAEMARTQKVPDAFTFRRSPNKNKPIDTIDIPVNTLLIRYSRDLFTLLSLKKNFDLNATLLDQFREGTYKSFN